MRNYVVFTTLFMMSLISVNLNDIASKNISYLFNSMFSKVINVCAKIDLSLPENCPYRDFILCLFMILLD